jgi:hypothetical protein
MRGYVFVDVVEILLYPKLSFWDLLLFEPLEQIARGVNADIFALFFAVGFHV